MRDPAEVSAGFFHRKLRPMNEKALRQDRTASE